MAAKKTAKTETTASPAPAPKPVKDIPANKIPKKSVDVLAVLHESGKLHTGEELATATGTTPKAALAALTPLVNELLVEQVDKEVKEGTTPPPSKFRQVGQRVSRLSDILKVLRDNGKNMSAAEVGKAIWADPKKPSPTDDTRFMAPAAAALKNAYTIGAIGRNTVEGTAVSYFAL